MIDCFVKSVASFQFFFYYRPMLLTLVFTTPVAMNHSIQLSKAAI